MKNIAYKLFTGGIILLMISIIACSKSYLEKGALGSTSEKTLATEGGVQGLLIGAYSLLDKGGWPSGNWVFGGVASDDAHTGTEAGALQPIPSFENYTFDATTYPLNDKWKEMYAGVQRANDVLRILAEIPVGQIKPDQATQIKAEAIFLRAYFHLMAAMMWKNVPYIDERVSFSNGNYNVPNTTPIWPFI